jgi:hypothetical protein
MSKGHFTFGPLVSERHGDALSIDANSLRARRLVRKQVQIQRRSDGRTVGLQGHPGKTGVAAVKCCVVNPSAQIFVMP